MESEAHKSYYFEDTVLDYYKHSNEVDIFHAIFKDLIFPQFKDYQINWLEVGIGDGEKILNALKLFQYKPNITFIEPSQGWIDNLTTSGNLERISNHSKIKVVQSSFENFTGPSHKFRFDLITFIQVLYEPILLQSFFDFIENERNEKPYTLVVNLEHEQNDFNNIRRRISDFYEVPSTQISTIEEFLIEKKIDFTKHTSKEKRLKIKVDEIITSLYHWFYPFILGVSKQTYNNIELETRNHIKKEIDQILRAKKSLNINDTTIIAKL